MVNITELLSEWQLEVKDEELYVLNPPTFSSSEEETEKGFNFEVP